MEKAKLTKQQWGLFVGAIIGTLLVAVYQAHVVYEGFPAAAKAQVTQNNIIITTMLSAIIGCLIVGGIYHLIVSFVAVDLNITYTLSMYYYWIAELVATVLNALYLTLFGNTMPPMVLLIVGLIFGTISIFIYCYQFVSAGHLNKNEAIKAGAIIFVLQVIVSVVGSMLSQK